MRNRKTLQDDLALELREPELRQAQPLSIESPLRAPRTRPVLNLGAAQIICAVPARPARATLH